MHPLSWLTPLRLQNVELGPECARHVRSMGLLVNDDDDDDGGGDDDDDDDDDDDAAADAPLSIFAP